MFGNDWALSNLESLPMRAFVFLAILSVSNAVLAHDYRAGPLKVLHPWSRATARSADVAAGFLTISNEAATQDRLVSVETAIAVRAEIHAMTMDGGIMRMRPLEGGLEIPSKKNVILAPGGLHIMFIGLRAPLVQGTRIPATLHFEKAGTVEVEFLVEGAGVTAPANSPEHPH
jgi:copper(I)-binding protein